MSEHAVPQILEFGGVTQQGLRSSPYLSLNMPFSPKNFRIPRPISFFLAKKGPQKLNSGNKYGGSDVFQLLRHQQEHLRFLLNL